MNWYDSSAPYVKSVILGDIEDAKTLHLFRSLEKYQAEIIKREPARKSAEKVILSTQAGLYFITPGWL